MQQILKADKLIGVFQVPFKKLAGVYFCFLFFLNLVLHDCEFFKRLQNLWYRSTHSYTNI